MMVWFAVSVANSASAADVSPDDSAVHYWTGRTQRHSPDRDA